MKRIVLGHLNPDTDTAVSSYVYSKIAYNISYPEAEVFLTGKPNKETLFVFEKFGIELPAMLEEIDPKSEIILVDHNIEKQRFPGMDIDQIIAIIDHHQVTFDSPNPIYIRMEPVGSTATILTEMLLEHAQIIPVDVSKLLVSGIVSDTLYFNSPTTKAIDRQMVDRMNKIARIPNLQKFANEMFEAKSDLTGLEMSEILGDAKEYEMGGKTIKIAVLETVRPDIVMERKDEILDFTKKEKEKKGYEASFVFVVNIMKKSSIALCVSDDENKAVKDSWMYHLEESSDKIFLDGAVSRKKQIQPILNEYFLKQ